MPRFVDSETTTPTIWEGRVELSLSTRTEGDHTVLEVGGEIDVYTAPKPVSYTHLTLPTTPYV